MFGGSGELLLPIAVVGCGSYGSTYKAKRFNPTISKRVWDHVQNTEVESSSPEGQPRRPPVGSATLPGAGTLPPAAREGAVHRDPMTAVADLKSGDALFDIVAVKEVVLDRAPDELEDVLKEVSFMSTMRHRHIVRYYSSFIHNGLPSVARGRLGLQRLQQALTQLLPRSAAAAFSNLGQSPADGTLHPTRGLSSPAASPADPPICFSSRPCMCVVEEYVGGMSLQELVRLRKQSRLQKAFQDNPMLPSGHGQLTKLQLATILHDTLQGLLYLHQEARIAHRDIKGGNILVSRVDGIVKICDFGTCGAIDSPSLQRSTVLGTPGWMAPEVLNSGQAGHAGYGPSADIWSLGITTLEVALLKDSHDVCEDPFVAKAVRYLSHAPCSCSPDEARIPSPFNLDPNDLFNMELQDFVSCCLRRNPVERPSAATLLAHPFIASAIAAAPEHERRRELSSLVRQATELNDDRGVDASRRAAQKLRHRRHFSDETVDRNQPMYPMRGTDLFDGVFVEAKHLSKPTVALQPPSAGKAPTNADGTFDAESFAMLKDVVTPAARGAVKVCRDIHTRFKVIAQLRDPSPPQGRPSGESIPDSLENPNPYLLASSFPEASPSTDARLASVMEQHIALLHKMEAARPGFARVFCERFVHNLQTNHPQGDRLMRDAMQLLRKLQSDPLAVNVAFDAASHHNDDADSSAIDSGPPQGESPPLYARMPGGSTSADPSEVVDATAFLYNQFMEQAEASR